MAVMWGPAREEGDSEKMLRKHGMVCVRCNQVAGRLIAESGYGLVHEGTCR